MAVTAHEGAPGGVTLPAEPLAPTLSVPLVEMVRVIKHELGVDGTIVDVVAAGCAQLNIPTEGRSVVMQAELCYQALGHGMPPAVVHADTATSGGHGHVQALQGFMPVVTGTLVVENDARC